MTTSLLIVFPSLLVVLIAVLQWKMPRLTRRDLWFAVTVSPDFPTSTEARQIERRYQATVAASAATALFVQALVGAHPLAAPAGLLLQAVLGTAAFLWARQQSLPYAVPATTIREAALVRPTPRLPIPLQLGPFVILMATAVWLRSIWEKLPNPIPLHWNAEGEVNRWAPKTPLAVFGPILTGACVCVFLLLMGRFVARSRRVAATGEAADKEGTFRYRMMGVVLASEYVVATTFALTAIPMSGGPLWPVTVAPVISVLLIVGLLTVAVRTGQGGSRMATDGGFGDRTADAQWKWGIFYVNRNDPAVFIEKRFGIGYTINFARPGAWFFIAAIVLLPVGLRLLTSVLPH